jgi:hypothetical protein
MKKIKMVVELNYDAEMMHNGNKDKESKDWFFNEILISKRGDLRLHSNEIGDEIGEIKVIKILP